MQKTENSQINPAFTFQRHTIMLELSSKKAVRHGQLPQIRDISIPRMDTGGLEYSPRRLAEMGGSA